MQHYGSLLSWVLALSFTEPGSWRHRGFVDTGLFRREWHFGRWPQSETNRGSKMTHISPHFIAGSQKRFYREMKDRAKSSPVNDLENDSVIAITAAGRSFVAESTGGDIRED